MKKEEIIAFFDKMAPQWDADMIRDDAVIDTILNYAEVKAGNKILDVACGTGVLFPDYINRKAASITGIDISPEMARIAQKKFPQINVICGDVENVDFNRKFDVIMVYNALPHFNNIGVLLNKLNEHLAENGIITVAHSMSREKLIRHHEGAAAKVSRIIPEMEDMVTVFNKVFNVISSVSNDEMYQISGSKK